MIKGTEDARYNLLLYIIPWKCFKKEKEIISSVYGLKQVYVFIDQMNITSTEVIKPYIIIEEIFAVITWGLTSCYKSVAIS